MKHNTKLYAQMRARGYVTLTEAISRAQLPRSTLYDAMLAEKIESTNVGKRKFLLEKSLVEFLGPVGSDVYRSNPPPDEVLDALEEVPKPTKKVAPVKAKLVKKVAPVKAKPTTKRRERAATTT